MGCGRQFPVAAALLGVCAFFAEFRNVTPDTKALPPAPRITTAAQPRRFENAQGCRLWPARPATARYGEPDY